MPSATIKIFLVHGDPKRLRIAELSNWNGKAVAGPRSEFDGITSREECQKSGVYFLTGIDPETGRSAVYVGEAECVKDRIRSHLAKDYWNQISFFVSKDENLTKAHIRYLEGRLIEQAIKAGRALVKNGQNSGSKLPESDREDMEVFLEKIHQLLPVLGVEFLVPAGALPASLSEKQRFFCRIHDLEASGHLSPSGFVILAGSQAVLKLRDSTERYPWVINLRKQLEADGGLKLVGDHLQFSRDVDFSSPSAAAAVVHGGTANGLTAWKNVEGKTLKQLESGP